MGVQEELMAAVEEGDMEGVKAALQQGADAEKKNVLSLSPLLLAAKAGQSEVVEYLLDCVKVDVGVQRADGWHAIHLAAMNDHATTIRVLVKHGADVNERAGRNHTPPLCIACAYGSDRAVVELIRSGADVNGCDKKGMTPLMSACHLRGLPTTVSLLLDSGAKVELTNERGETAVDIVMEATPDEEGKYNQVEQALSMHRLAQEKVKN